MGEKFYCNDLADRIINEVSEKIKNKYPKGTNKALVIIRVGEDEASKVYVRNKERACEKIGIKSAVIVLGITISTDELLNVIRILNLDSNVLGILIQLPLPNHLNKDRILNAVYSKKDVDGFHRDSVLNILNNTDGLRPCTADGIMEILSELEIDVEGKNCVVVGRSSIVGRPVAQMLLNKNATVTVCHSKTINLEEYTKRADIVIMAVGKAKMLKSYMIKEGAILIDVGMNRDEEGKLCGDIDTEDVLEKCSFVTPVPNGVGKMTVAMLMKNVTKYL